MKSNILFLILTCCVCMFASCKKGNDNTINGGYVDAYIYLSDPSSVQLNAVGGWIYYSGGLRGLIIYRRSQDEFGAYDRTCTYDPDATCALVEVENTNITAIDSCCGSRYQITDGLVVKAPATQSLIQYRTTFDGDVLHIFN